MINCPNCNHQNPDGALQCEACYTPLPALATCPNCNATVQADASFCGQCGSDLRNTATTSGSVLAAPEAPPSGSTSTAQTQNFIEPALESSTAEVALPGLVSPDPLVAPDPIAPTPASTGSGDLQTEAGAEANTETGTETTEELSQAPTLTPVPSPSRPIAATQLQTLSVRLRQVQTDTVIEVPRELSVVRIGKTNEHTPPDIDVSGFPDSEIVSRVHANLRAEGDTYYLEDVGSSNGTYINGLPLPVGNRHRLRPGDRIALGKGDKVSFIFESSS
ncbi:MAG: FHA domain-containing protein [Cyanobacteria bacterium J06614_10]